MSADVNEECYNTRATITEHEVALNGRIDKIDETKRVKMEQRGGTFKRIL